LQVVQEQIEVDTLRGLASLFAQLSSEDATPVGPPMLPAVPTGSFRSSVSPVRPSVRGRKVILTQRNVHPDA
jgi:hypothetical protein